ncbi:MAG: mechanosensitive ion channel family protein [Saprospiraceae bacterium]|nr:mechanosensitive ion channel family protein [Saprospiraceae bacterium]
MTHFFEDIKVQVLSYYDNLVVLFPKLVVGVVLFLLIYLFSRWIRTYSLRRLKLRMDDPLLARFVSNLVGTVFVIIAFLVLLQAVGLGEIAIGLLSTAGLGAFILGFAFKDIGENFLSGIVLAFKRPFRVGDTVELNGHAGKVITLNLRDVQIKTFDGKDIFIPNANVIKNAVINYTIDGFLRQEFTIGLDYESNMEEAVKIIQETVSKNQEVLSGERSPSVVYGDLAASTLNVKVQYWINTFEANVPGLILKRNLIDQVLDALNKNGFYLPSDIIEVKSYKDKELPFKSQVA